MPNTVNIGLNTPNTGDLPGAWGTAALNNNFIVIDGTSAGFQTVSLTNANVSLSIATGAIGTGSLTPGAGPTQSANAKITFAGTLTGNCTITFPRGGTWIVNNACTLGGFSVLGRASGTGNIIGLPPGESVHVFCDGTNLEFCDLGRVGSFLDLCVATTPAWMSACTVLPYLPCVGTATYSVTTYPALGAMLGSTWGGNGITTFGVPDLANRARVSIDTAGAGRLTFAGSAITGTLLGATGGNQTPQAHTHTAAVTDPGHIHGFPYGSTGGGGNGAVPANTITSPNLGAQNTQSATTSISVSNATAFSGGSGNVQPSIVFGVTFIKT